MKIEILEGIQPLIDLRSEWSELADQSPWATVFQTPEWLLSWLSKKPLGIRTVSVREGQDLVGLYILKQRPAAWLTYRPAGIGPSDYLAPLVTNQEAATEMMNALLGSKADLLDLHQVREDHPFASAIDSETHTFTQAECCVLDLPATFDEYVTGLSKSLRYETKRTAKEPYTNGKAVIRTAQNPEEAQEFFEIFLNLHVRRWKKRGLPGAFALPGIQRFHRTWLSAAVGQDKLRLRTLWWEGKPIAALYAMKHGEVYYFYQSGFDPNFTAQSPGTVLVADTIRMAIDEGMKQFDFLRGAEAYKLRWKPQQTLKNYRLMRKNSPLVGGAGFWVNELGHRVDQKVRLRLEGKSLK